MKWMAGWRVGWAAGKSMGGGSSSFERKGEILALRAEGEIDTHQTCEFIARAKNLNESCKLPVRGLLVDLLHWEGVSPEALDETYSFYEWCAEQGAVATAFVAPPDYFVRGSATRYEAVRRRMHLKWFESTAAAWAWFAELGLALHP
ncbi:MAG: hypothetical protein JO370_16645 [Paucibacter sp.]|nr:hypothetical protein [Roseateles sp.]